MRIRIRMIRVRSLQSSTLIIPSYISTSSTTSSSSSSSSSSLRGATTTCLNNNNSSFSISSTRYHGSTRYNGSTRPYSSSTRSSLTFPPQQQKQQQQQSLHSRRHFVSSTRINNPNTTTTSHNPNTNTNTNTKPYYITTPIFYVNAAPHVGHLYSMVIADILKRWQLVKGRPAILCTGTDEHGMKVHQASIKNGSDSPKAFCDRGAQLYQSLAKAANISYDHFVRTTDPDHKEAVQFAWSVLQERDYIYMAKHSGWYSISDEAFYPQSQVQQIVVPSTGHKIMASKETGKEVVWTSEQNYKFRLSSMAPRLLEFYKANPQFIVPQRRMDDIVEIVTQGLEDLSVSRPSSRLSWGIPVPTDHTQTIYVWLDALINYVTKAGYPWQPGQERALGWPADVQVIGKDITRFHCIYWPAFLLALDIPPPKQVLTHAHWTLGNMKMAKSTGNVVSPLFAFDRFGVEVIRYYLAHDGNLLHDSDYGNEMIIERYRKNLQHSLGNLLSRVTRGKFWNVRRAVQFGAAAASPGLDSFRTSDVASAHLDTIVQTPVDFSKKMDELNIGAAIHAVTTLINSSNKFMHDSAPWNLGKEIAKLDQVAGTTTIDRTGESSESESESTATTTATEASARKEALQQDLDRIIFLQTETLRITAILLQPVMPNAMARLLDMLGVDESARTFVHARFAADETYGVSKFPLGAGHVGVLFPPLTCDS